MKSLDLYNPFNAPVYYIDTVSSTMDVSRRLAEEDQPHGTVIIADFQESGRGRGQDQGQNRTWEMQSGVNLPFTVLLRFSGIKEIPPALTLRTGLAVSYSIEDFTPSLRGNVKVKWPNDIMIDSKKAVGILCEADGGNVHVGIGINVAQMDFPAHLQEKATSIALASGENISIMSRFVLLEKILLRIYDELETDAGENWKSRLDERLYKKDENVLFIDGAVSSGKEVKGRLCGIGDNGELLVIPKDKKEPQSFITGELVVY